MSFLHVGHSFSTNFSATMKKTDQTKDTTTAIEIRLKRKYRFLIRRGEYTRILREGELPTAVKLFRVKISCLIHPQKWKLLISDMISSMDFRGHQLEELEQQIKVFIRSKAEEVLYTGHNEVEMVLEIEDSVIELYDQEEAITQAATNSMNVGGSRAVPASRASIEALKTEKYDGRNSGGNCRICLDEFCDGIEITNLPCSHVFHGGCIRQWLAQRNFCPLCRHAI